MSKQKSYLDFWSAASSLFLTEPLTYKEYDELATKGEAIPKCQAYEDWEVDGIEESINQTAEELFKAYEQGFKEGKNEQKTRA